MKKLYTFLFLSLFAATIYAQPIIDWNTFSRPVHINDWVEHDNTVYIATDVGIYLMDKTTFTVTEHWNRGTAGLPSNKVEGIAFHPTTQTMYIGTYDIGIGLQAADGTWETMPYPEEVLNPGYIMHTFCLIFDDQERLMTGTSYGMFRLENGEWQLYDHITTQEPFFGEIWNMEKTVDGTVYMAGGLLSRVVADTIQILNEEGEFGHTLFSYNDARLHIHGDGSVLLFSDLGEAGRFDGEEWEYWSILGGTDQISFHQSRYLLEEGNGDMTVDLGWQGFAHYDHAANEWALSADDPFGLSNAKGVWRVDDQQIGITNDTIVVFGESGQTYQKLGDPLMDETVWRMRKDKLGNLWSRGATNNINNLTTGNSLTLEVPDETLYIYDFAFNQNNELWVHGNYSIHLFDDENLVTSYTPENSILPESSLRFMVVDAQNQLWGWVFDDDVYVLVNGEWTTIPWPTGSILTAVPHKDEGILISTYDDFYIELKHLTLSGSTTITLPQNWVSTNFTTFNYDADQDAIWVANAFNEMAVWDGQSWTEKALPEEWNEEDYVREIRASEFGLLVYGLYQFAFLENGIWYYYNQENLPMDTDRISEADMDSEGNFWVDHQAANVLEQFITSWVTATDEIFDGENFENKNIYPNPATSTVRAEWMDEPGTLFVINVSGQILQTEERSNINQELTVSQLTAGHYWLLWKSEDGGRKVRAPFVKI